MSEDTDTFYLLGNKSTIATDNPEIWLGRVVTNYKIPRSSYGPAATDAFRGVVSSDTGHNNVSEFLKSKRSKVIYTALANVVTGSLNQSYSNSPSIQAAKVEMLTIENHSQVWKRLQNDKDALAEVDALDWSDRKAYLIVGLYVTEAVKYAESKSSESGVSLHTKIPTKEITAATIGLPIDAPIENKIEQTTEKGREGGTDLENKRIFAIQYRILRKHRIRKSKGVELSKDYLKGDRTFADGDVEEESVDTEIVLDEDMLLEDEVDDEEQLFEA